MANSMTGFGTATVPIDEGELRIELRSVNSRFLEIHPRLPDSFRRFEPRIRNDISARCQRGKVTVELRQAENLASFPDARALDEPRLRKLAELSETIFSTIPRAQGLNIEQILAFPGVLQSEQRLPEELEEDVSDCLAAALDELVAARSREGNALARAIVERLDAVQTLTAEIRSEVPTLREHAVTRLRERISEFSSEELDMGRLEQELAIVLQRADFEEELDRLDAHVEECRRALARSGAIGRRLDFLMQELAREANTLASKASTTETGRQAVELKVLVEQMREQVQNIE